MFRIRERTALAVPRAILRLSFRTGSSLDESILHQAVHPEQATVTRVLYLNDAASAKASFIVPFPLSE